MLLSSGDYLLFIDADDCIVPSCLSLFSNAVIQYDNPDLVIANVDCPQYKYRKFENRYVNSNQEIRKIYFAHGVFEMPWNKLIRRDFLLSMLIQWYYCQRLHIIIRQIVHKSRQ